mmetsp:Transcript_25167/g.56811  ORF Transcript_25167/g.56811 Transcript_25167/m.56811 type:complete len:267 (-) Transcript_25167:1536-2336(-)
MFLLFRHNLCVDLPRFWNHRHDNLLLVLLLLRALGVHRRQRLSILHSRVHVAVEHSDPVFLLSVELLEQLVELVEGERFRASLLQRVLVHLGGRELLQLVRDADRLLPGDAARGIGRLGEVLLQLIPALARHQDRMSAWAHVGGEGDLPRQPPPHSLLHSCQRHAGGRRDALDLDDDVLEGAHGGRVEAVHPRQVQHQAPQLTPRLVGLRHHVQCKLDLVEHGVAEAVAVGEPQVHIKADDQDAGYGDHRVHHLQVVVEVRAWDLS